METHRLELCWTDRKSKFSPNVRRKIKKHEFQADYDRRSVRKLGEIIESQQEEFHCAQAEELQRRDNNFFMNGYYSNSRNHVKLIIRVSMKWMNLKQFQSSTFDTIARRILVEDQDTVLELTGKIQDLQNEIYCMSDSKDFQDAESIRSGHSHVTSQPVSFPPHPIPGGIVSRSIGMPSRREGLPSIWDTHGISGNVFADPVASSTAPYQQELNAWSSGISEPIHSSTAEKNENQTPVQDQRCQSGPSARSRVVPSEGGFSQNYGADQQRLQISDPHFDKFPTPATFACWKKRFKTEVCTCSQFPTDALHWIKEVEMADSVDDSMSSSSTRGIHMLNFEVLDARIASALNRIIPNSHVRRRVSLEEQKAQKEDRFFRGRQIAYLIYEYFRVTGAKILSTIMPTYSLLLFEMMIFRNSIQSGTEFYDQ